MLYVTKTIAPGSVVLKDAAGEFEVAFSPVDQVDLDGDIIRRTAITDGIKLPAMWAHEHSAMPLGIGTVSHTATHAVLTGKFIDSTAGRDARATIKETAEIQELSWGFSLVESNIINVDGQSVREITRTTPHEVSFVLRGAAGPGQTGVLAVKDDGGLRFASEAETVRAAVLAFRGRADALAALRDGDGRDLSDAVKARIVEVATALEDAVPAFRGLTEQVKEDDVDDDDIQARLRATALRLVSPTARS